MNGVGNRSLSAFALGCALLLFGCGGGRNSANSSTNTGNTGTSAPTTGSSNPGSTGGTGSGTTGSSGSGGTGSGTTGGTTRTSTTYLYSGTAISPGEVRGYKVDTSSGTLTEVSGSPFALSQNGFSTGGAITASNGFVYAVNRPGEQTAVSVYTFKSDSSTGALTLSGNPVPVTPQSDPDVREIKLSPDGKTAYMTSQWNVYAVALNDGSPATLNSQPLTTGDVWGFAVAGHFAYAGIQDGNPKSGFAQPVIKRMVINADGSLGTPQTIATLADANIPYDLATDANGKFLAATTGFNSGDVSVWAVSSTTGDLAAVPGSPFSTSGGILKFLRFDPSGTHLYAINNPDFEPRHEDIRVFSVGGNGALTSTQTVDLGDGQQATDFKVEDNFAYITNATGGGQSNVTVLRQDTSSGQLSVANKASVASPLGGVATLRF